MVKDFLVHCADGKNYATGKKGAHSILSAFMQREVQRL
jgi:hypothetical protein